MFSTIIKRDGRTAAYDVEKIAKAIFQAATSVGGRDFETAHALALQVQQRLEETYPSSQSPTVEQIQDMVEKVLIDTGHSRTAKEYILYRAQRTRVVRTTAYTHSERDHLAYGPRNAVGTALKYTSSVRSAAADWSVYPLGTTFRIKGQPYLYVVDDYGSALVGTGTIDIYQPNKKLMKEWGRRYVELTIVRWGDPANSLEVLGSRRGYRHCRAMYAALQHRVSKGFYAKAD